MYCKNCGKILNPGDRFCSGCGTKVELGEEAKIEAEFIPDFKKSAVDVPQTEEKPRRTFHLDEFNWDLNGYPTDNRKTEDVDFNWTSVMEEKKRRTAEPRVPLYIEKEETKVSSPVKEPAGEPTARRPEKTLEEEIFEDMGTLADEEPTKIISGHGSEKSEKVDKFYTFNKKNEELQALLEQEYERIKNGSINVTEEDTDEQEQADDVASAEEIIKPKRTSVEFDWTLPVSSFEETEPVKEETVLPHIPEVEYICTFWSQPPAGYTAPEEEKTTAEPVSKAQDVTAEPITSSETVGAQKEALSPRAEDVVNKEESSAETEKAEEKPEAGGEVCPPCTETEEEKRTKLAFDDVFGDDDDSDADKAEKKGKGLKVIAVILCILVVAELCVIGIQYFAPESSAGKMINEGYRYVIGLFDGDDDSEPAGSGEADVPKTSEISDLLETYGVLNQNIGKIEEDGNLTFSPNENYGFDDFESSYAFENKPWYTAEDGTTVTYGDEIVKTLIGYYSSWVDYINGENEDILDYIDVTSDFYGEIEGLEAEKGVTYGINSLKVGEIRAGSAGFYLLTEVVIVDSQRNGGKEERHVLYMEPEQKTMKIVELKEL